MTLDQVVAKLRRACDRAGSQTAWGAPYGVAVQKINDVLAGRREPTPDILDALDLEKAPTEYRRKSVPTKPTRGKGKANG